MSLRSRPPIPAPSPAYAYENPPNMQPGPSAKRALQHQRSRSSSVSGGPRSMTPASAQLYMQRQQQHQQQQLLQFYEQQQQQHESQQQGQPPPEWVSYRNTPQGTPMQPVSMPFNNIPASLTMANRLPAAYMSSPAAYLRDTSGLRDLRLEVLDTGQFIGRAGMLVAMFLTYEIPYRHVVHQTQDEVENRRRALSRRGVAVVQWPLIQDGKRYLLELGPAMRYLARIMGLYGQCDQGDDAYEDYQADFFLCKILYWRDALSRMIGEELDHINVDAYAMDNDDLVRYFGSSKTHPLQCERAAYYKLFEFFLEYGDSTFLTGNTFDWVDVALFTVLYEDQILCRAVQKVPHIQVPQLMSFKANSSGACTPIVFAFDSQRYPHVYQFFTEFLKANRQVSLWVIKHDNVFLNIGVSTATSADDTASSTTTT